LGEIFQTLRWLTQTGSKFFGSLEGAREKWGSAKCAGECKNVYEIRVERRRA